MPDPGYNAVRKGRVLANGHNPTGHHPSGNDLAFQNPGVVKRISGTEFPEEFPPLRPVPEPDVVGMAMRARGEVDYGLPLEARIYWFLG